MDKNGNERPAVAALVAARERVGEKVSIYLRGQRWWATYMHEKRQRREPLNTTNKKEARRKAIQIEAKLMDGSLRPKLKLPLIGLPSGVRHWVRVRANGPMGPGPWSDEASKMVP